MKQYSTIRLILGDQLNRQHSWYREHNSSVLYVLMECRSETDYVTHHIQKIAAFFLGMRAMAAWLREQGHEVAYLALDEAGNQHDIPANLQLLFAATGARRFEYQLPDEYRLDKALRQFTAASGFAYGVYDTEHFYTTRDEAAQLFKGKKTWLMESFYRQMRRKHRVLMQGEEPVGERWNFDAENRKSVPAGMHFPEPPIPAHPIADLVSWLEQQGVQSLGTVPDGLLRWPIQPHEARQLLDYFIESMLPRFGDYQDAMTQEHRFLFHSRLSFALNAKIISPQEVVDAAEKAWRREPDRYPLSAVEGFIRQILGWREYMRGIYWGHVPGYYHMNYFEHTTELPAWFWTGNTRMACLKAAITQSLENAYAHHIQRLMITGNFALLAGVHPDEVDRWYLGIYIDAVEWVEITNTRGMSQFADGGIVGTKPYVSSANYISKMSDYCKNCHYDAKKRTGEGACPFNSLYWDFHARHREKLEKNPRIGMVYRSWDKMEANQQQALREQAALYLQNIDRL
jgi:deoxyribodipyrimidine photolyase-related protein